MLDLHRIICGGGDEKKMLKTVWSIARLQIRCAILSPKAWVALLIGLLIGATAGQEYWAVALQLGYPLQVVEPALTLILDRLMIVFAVIGVAFLLSDVPFSNKSTSYLVFRAHRRIWMLGNALYMLIVCFAYIFIIILASIAVSASYAYVQNLWSPLARLLIQNQQKCHLISYRVIEERILLSMSPYKACFLQWGLLSLYSFAICGVMLLVNTLQRRSVGFAVAMLFHGLMFVMHLDGHPVGYYLSLFTYANAGLLPTQGIPQIVSFLVLSGFAACMCGLSIGLSRRMDI